MISVVFDGKEIEQQRCDNVFNVFDHKLPKISVKNRKESFLISKLGFNSDGSIPTRSSRTLNEFLSGTGPLDKLVELQEMNIANKNNESSDEYLHRVFNSFSTVFHFIHSNDRERCTEELLGDYIYLQTSWHMFKYFGYSEAWYLEGGYSACLFE